LESPAFTPEGNYYSIRRTIILIRGEGIRAEKHPFGRMRGTHDLSFEDELCHPDRHGEKKGVTIHRNPFLSSPDAGKG
jgi:hypothetical protein